MLKHGILTILVTMLFAVTPAMAGDNDNLSQDYEDNLEANRDAKGMPHPAHEMGKGNVFDDKEKPCKEMDKKSSDKADKDVSKAYKENLENAREAENMPHPAHEMGEGNTFDEKE